MSIHIKAGRAGNTAWRIVLGSALFLMLAWVYTPEVARAAPDEEASVGSRAEERPAVTPPPEHGTQHSTGIAIDAATSATLARASVNGKSMVPLDFALLKTTQVGRKPPPIYLPKLSAVQGRDVAIAGYMAPYDDLKNLHQFMLMNVPVGCYFCAPPSPLEVVFVRQREKKTEYIDGPIMVKGRMLLWTDQQAERDPMHEMFLYVIDDAVVEPIK